jgi:hypothetical protein
VAGVKDIKDHLVWVEPVSGMAFDASYKEPTGTASPTGAASTDGQYAHCTSGGDFSLSQEDIMKIRWALFSAAILIGFLPSQVTSEEAVLGHGMTILLQRPEPRGF